MNYSNANNEVWEFVELLNMLDVVGNGHITLRNTQKKVDW